MRTELDLFQDLRDSVHSTLYLFCTEDNVHVRNATQIAEDIRDFPDGVIIYKMERKRVDTEDIPTKFLRED